MTALTANRETTEERGVPWSMLHEIDATDSTQYFIGGMVAIDPSTGKLVKAVIDDNTLIVAGICQENVLTGVSTTRKIKVRSGVFSLESAAIDATDRGAAVYVADDQTVTLTSGDDAQVGTLYDYDAKGAWVSIQYPLT